MPRLTASLARLDALQKHTHHLAIPRTLEQHILIAGIDVGVVVDLDEVVAFVRLLDVRAIEAVADEISRLAWESLSISLGALVSAIATAAPAA